MRKIRTLIVDDEPIAQDILESFIEKTNELELAGKCRNALEAFQVISKGNIDLLLLDINMPEITGIDLLKNLKNPPLVIFTTAYSEYAVESYELNAIDYLLKPIAYERFVAAIKKVKDATGIQSNPNTIPVPEKSTADNIMFVKAEGKLIRINLAELWFAEGLKDYVRLWTEHGKIIIHSTMKNFEDSLAAYGNFTRVHKSYIVNMQYISEIEGNMMRIKGQTIAIGNTYKEEVHKMLNNYKLL
jgi:DNA-binding LytR/AlgR family response regulator